MNFIIDLEYFDSEELTYLKGCGRVELSQESVLAKNKRNIQMLSLTPSLVGSDDKIKKIFDDNKNLLAAISEEYLSKKNKKKNILKDLLEDNSKFKEFFDLLKHNGCYIHSIVFPPKAWLKERDEAKTEYIHIASPEEIERIIKPSNPEDFILKERADSILSNMRIIRYFETKALLVSEDDWKLENQFDDSIINTFFSNIDDIYYAERKNIVFGTVYSEEIRANISKTFGKNVILLNESFNHFFYYMNMVYSGFWFKENIIDGASKGTALQIALRIMLKVESFDFDLDPRASFPKKLKSELQLISEKQILFILAHEFGHHINNHLIELGAENTLLEMIPAQVFDDVYNNTTRQKQMELEADATAIIILAGKSIKMQKEILMDAVMVMSFFHLYETFKNSIKATSSSTHPTSKERQQQLYKWGVLIWSETEKTIVDQIIDNTGNLLTQVLALLKNKEFPLFYGGLYFKQWKPALIVDRQDY